MYYAYIDGQTGHALLQYIFTTWKLAHSSPVLLLCKNQSIEWHSEF